MKKIETLIFALIISFLIYSCTNEEHATDFQQSEAALKIGTIVNGEFKFDNKSDFKAQWEQRLKNDGFNAQLTNFEIEYGDVGVDGTRSTILVAQSEDQTFKTAIQIEEINNQYFEVAAAGSITCTGCRIGCNPEQVTIDSVLQWICTSCIIGDDCIKTIKKDIQIFN